MPRTPVIAVGLLVAALAAGAAWWAFRGEARPADAPEDAQPKAAAMDPLRAREISHRDPWPHAAFEPDFLALRDATQSPELDENTLKREVERKTWGRKVAIRMPSATVREVVDHLKEQLAPAGVNVFTYDTGDLVQWKFNLDFEAIEVERLIDEMRAQTGDDLRYYVTSQGLCLGSVRDIQQAQIDARGALAKKRAAAEESSNVYSGKQFRPDFADAWVGPIARLIREQTGVEVVVDSATWSNGRTLTWRSEPIPLRDAVRRIAQEMGCVARVRDGRIFLVQP